MRRTSDKAPSVAAPEAPRETTDQVPDFRMTPHAAQALRTIEGERQAGDFLAVLHAGRAEPDELALIVSMLYGATLRGFCRVIVRALQGRTQ